MYFMSDLAFSLLEENKLNHSLVEELNSLKIDKAKVSSKKFLIVKLFLLLFIMLRNFRLIVLEDILMYYSII